MASDIVINAGIKFNPRDVDTKAIKDAVVRSLSTTRIEINKVRIGREARVALESAIKKTSFRIDKAKFGRDGLTALRKQLRQHLFSINNVQFSSRALSNLNKQLKGTRFEIAQATPAQPRSAQPGQGAQSTRQQTQQTESFTGAVLRNRQALQEQLRDLQAFAVGTTGAERAQRNFLQSVAQGAVSLQGFGANIIKITQRFSAYLVSIKSIIVAQRAFSESLRVIFEFDAALQDLVKVVDTTRTSLEDLGAGLFRVANATGNTVQAVAESTGQFVRQGLEVPEALERTRAALIGVNAANISVNDSTKLVTVALRVFGSEIDSAVEALDILNITADNAATNQQNIVQALLRSGSAAAAVGVSFRELNAIIAATVEQTQLSGNRIGSALKTIFARLATNTSGFREQANALGANIQAGDGLLQTLQKLADVFPSLTADQQAQLTTLAAGKRRFTEFSAILQQLERDSTGLSRIQELLNVQLEAAGNTAAKNEAELQKLSTRAQQTANAFSEFVSILADSAGGGGIAGTIGEAFDILTDFGTSLTQIVRSAQSFRNEFFSLFDVIQNIGKAAFFTIVPTVLRAIISGAKTFLGIGTNLNKVLANTSNSQRNFNTALQEGAGLAGQEARQLSATTKELRNQVRLRQLINSIASEGFATGGVRGQVERLKRVRGQNTPASATAQVSLLSRVSGQVGRSLKRMGSTLAKTRLNIDNFGARIGLTAVALQSLDAVGQVASDFADSLEANGDKASAGLVEAGSSALQLGGQIGLLAGPLAGLITGVSVLAVDTFKLKQEIDAQADAASRAVTELGSMRVALGEVERTGSKDLVEAFKDLDERARSTDPSVAAQALVNSGVLVTRALRFLATESSELNQAFKRSGEVLSRVSNEVARALRETRIQERVSKVVSGLQERISEQTTPGAANAGPFEEIASLSAEIQRAVAGTNTRLLTQEEILRKVLNIRLANQIAESDAADRAALRAGTDADILKQAQAENDVLTNLRLKREQLQQTAEDELGVLKEQLASFEQGARLVERLNNRQKAAAEQAVFFQNIQEDINKILTESAVNEKQIETINKTISRLTTNIKNTSTEITKLSEQENKLVQDRTKELEEIEALIRAQISASEVGLATFERQNREREKQNDLLEQNNRSIRALTQLEINANTFTEQRTLAIARVNVERDKEIAKVREAAQAQLALLNNSREVANLLGNEDVVQALDAAIERTRQLIDEQSREVNRQFDLEVNAALNKTSVEAFKRAEQTLRNFRIQQIEDVARIEQQATERRIEFIKRIGETVAGRGLIRDRSEDLRGASEDERQFGLITAAILRQFEDQGDNTINALIQRLDQLRVSGINTFQELRQLKERERDLNAEISRLINIDANASKIQAARDELARISSALEEVKERGIDSSKELSEVSGALAEARTIKEENLARRREAAIDNVENAVNKLNEAEKQLVQERNKVPAANQKIIEAQRSLAQAEGRVQEATKSLSDANQNLADANFKLALDVELAEFKARQSAGGFRSVQGAISSLTGAFQRAAAESRASFEEILDARREVLQEEVNLVQNQLQALRGLSQRAFTADPEQLSQLQQAVGVASQVQAGQIGAEELVQLPPELRQALSGLTNAFPALQSAIDEVGARLLGFEPGAFRSLEQQLVELQTGIVQTGEVQVQQAEEQVRTAQEQLQESREQKDLAQQQLENSIAQKEALLASVSQSATNAAVSRLGFRDQVRSSNRILVEARRGAESTVRTESAIKELQARQNELVAEIKRTAQSSGEQLGILRSVQPTLDQTRSATQETAKNVAQNVSATQNLESRVAEGNASIVSAINSLRSNNSGSNASSIPTNARGSLTSSEINGLLRAASFEKRGMPTGSKLMLANTSETVLTKQQARNMGLFPRPSTHAQGGNAVVDGTAFENIASQLTSLNTRLQDISSRAAQPQQINVNLDSSRNIRVEGINDLQSSLQDIVTQRLGNTPSQEEVNVISQTVSDVIQRMKESGNENFQNL